MRLGPQQPGIERLEAFFTGHGFEPHRHDTYAVGVTLHGVQSFGYRGTTAHSLRGQAVILHPDEVHDGRAGTEAGFLYRIAYIEPRLLRQALDGRPLPFASDPVTSDTRLISAIAPALDDLDGPLEDLQWHAVLDALAGALALLDRSAMRRPLGAPCLRAVARAREYLDASVGAIVSSEELEAVTGLSRFALARHFRACLGTSPYRYLLMRRLDHARHLMMSGLSLAAAAAASGFADQGHMSRQFKKAYGMSPGRWQRATGLLR